MTTRSRMVHRACVERATAGVDAYGNALPSTWVVSIAVLPCYYYQPAGRGQQAGEVNVNLYVTQLLVPWSTDIHEGDRVNGVKDRLGAYLTPEVMRVVAIVFKPQHLIITLEVAS